MNDNRKTIELFAIDFTIFLSMIYNIIDKIISRTSRIHGRETLISW